MKASTDQFLKYSLGTLELIIQQFQGSWGGIVLAKDAKKKIHKRGLPHLFSKIQHLSQSVTIGFKKNAVTQPLMYSANSINMHDIIGKWLSINNKQIGTGQFGQLD